MKIRNKKVLLVLIIIAVVLLALTAAFLIIEERFRIEKVNVTGNERYSDDEIKEMVMSGRFSDNSLYLKLRSSKLDDESIPFIEKMDINIDDPNEITINVYEKAVAGCVSYLGQYIYFDKDGIVVESSPDRVEGVPFVTGIKFDKCVMNEYLPVENPEVFANVLVLTQLMEKYNIKTDRLYFDRNMNVTLYFDKARVLLGTMDNIDDKMIRL
ncbi:MAG: FtsQ-type POTRA domain-containing protein, partial [Lachnospiraceae bacterium]|nr:FtsQ-type POTRA domain-containing protein [Lachnospiraceae bacterium]